MVSWKNDYIPVNGWSRSGKKLKGVRKLVLHWTANNGATDENHHDYFEHQDDRYASAHIFVDKDSATCIVPLTEMCYHANDNAVVKNGVPYRGVKELLPNANELSIGVEMCVEKNGTIHPDTISRTINVMVDLCKMFKLKASDIVRHYDVTKKVCPKPFVENPDLFVAFKSKVNAKLNPPKPTPVKPVSPKYPNRVISKGSKDSASIKLIQNKLGIKADGIFGSGTENAVINFQKKNKLSADGKIGQVTWSKLF